MKRELKANYVKAELISFPSINNYLITMFSNFSALNVDGSKPSIFALTKKYSMGDAIKMLGQSFNTLS